MDPDKRVTQIEDICFQLMEQIVRGFSTITVNSDNSSSSCQETDEYFTDSSSSKKSQTSINFKRKQSRCNFALTVAALQRAHEMLVTGSKNKINIRSFFYELKPDLEKLTQDKVNHAIDNVGKLLTCDRWDLGFVATSKGLVAGHLILEFQDRSITCSNLQPDLIPQEITNLISLETTATFVLVVEKDTVFQHLLGSREKLLERHKCIMITGKGEPDLPTRILVNYLSENLKLPTFILVDNNPHGFEIMCTYRFGSINHKQWAAPSARWIGMHPTDMGQFNIKSMLLTENDKKKLQSLKIRSDLPLTKDLRRQLRKMKKLGKAELESVMKLGKCYLSTSYIPDRITLNEFY